MTRPNYQPENGFLLDIPRRRLTEKSAFLLQLEERQAQARRTNTGQRTTRSDAVTPLRRLGGL